MPRTLVLIMALVLAGGLAGCARTKVVAEPTPTAVLLAPEECVALEDKLKNIGRGPRMTPCPPEQFVSLDAAERKAAFDILLPGYLPEAAVLQCVQLPGARAVTLIYGGGLTVRQVAASAAPLWPLKDLAKDEWVSVMVSGAAGIGHEPSDVQAIGGTLHNNGSVTWWNKGVTYVVTGDLPLPELLRISESME
jgi:hypothetical protein